MVYMPDISRVFTRYSGFEVDEWKPSRIAFCRIHDPTFRLSDLVSLPGVEDTRQRL
jgi:hypothetical protein